MYVHPDSDSSSLCEKCNLYGELKRKTSTLIQFVSSQVESTPELYYMSLTLTLASLMSTGEAQLVTVGSQLLISNTWFCLLSLLRGERRTLANRNNERLSHGDIQYHTLTFMFPCRPQLVT